MSKRKPLQERDVIRLIVSYETFKTQHKVEYEDLCYLIMGYQQNHIRWDELSSYIRQGKRPPERMNTMIDKGWFRQARAGKHSAKQPYAFITLEGRERVHDLIDYIMNSYTKVTLYRQDDRGGKKGKPPPKITQRELELPPERIYKYMDRRYKAATNGRWIKKHEDEITTGDIPPVGDRPQVIGEVDWDYVDLKERYEEQLP